MFWEIIRMSGSITPFPECDETKIFIYKVPFTLHPLVGLMHNSTTAEKKKHKKIAKSMP